MVRRAPNVLPLSRMLTSERTGTQVDRPDRREVGHLPAHARQAADLNAAHRSRRVAASA